MIASTLVSAEAIDLLLPKSSSKTTQSKSVSVSINKNLEYFVNRKKVSKGQLEREILAKVGNNQRGRTITLRIEESVAMKNAVFVMDIANRNRIKSSLAVRAK